MSLAKRVIMTRRKTRDGNYEAQIDEQSQPSQSQPYVEQLQPPLSQSTDSLNVVPDISTSQSISTKRTRGAAKGWDYWGTGKKLSLQFNEFMQPVGTNSALLATHLGIIARNGLDVPLTFESWKKMPRDVLEKIWMEVQENTDAPIEYKAECLKSVGNKWKQWKSRVKNDHFVPHQNSPDRLELVPKRVVPEQWDALVKYWKNESVKMQAMKNRENQKNIGPRPLTGRASFANLRNSMSNEGEMLDKMSVYIISRTKKDGSIPDPEAVKLIAQMNAKLAEVPDAEQTPELRDKIFDNIMGPDGHGCVRTYGFGPSYTDVYSSSSQSKIIEEMYTKIHAEMEEKHQAQKSQMEQQYQAQQTQISDLQSQVATLLARIGTVHSSVGQIPDAAS